MAEVFCKSVSAPESWQISRAPDGTLTLALAAAVTVLYASGGSDTLAAASPAPECPLDPAYIWLLYAIPGSSQVHAVREDQVTALSGDYAVIGRVAQHTVHPYQPLQPNDTGASAINFIISGVGEVIATGYAGCLVVPYSCTITAAWLLADVSSTTTVDIARCTYSGYATATSLVASAPPALAAALKSQDTALTGWTTALVAQDILRFSVSANTAAKDLSIILLVAR